MNKSKNSTSITVRLSAAERQKLEQDSRAAGLSTSDYIQTLYLIFDYPHKHYTFKHFEI